MTKHGQAYTRLYRTWANMKQRCYNPLNDRYYIYGARGIVVCNDWLDFEPFQQWAILSGYTDQLTIDRINNNGAYTPSNCQWLTKGENSRKARIELGIKNREAREIATIKKEELKNERRLAWDKLQIELYGPLIKEMLGNKYKNWMIMRELNIEKNLYYSIKKNLDI